MNNPSPTRRQRSGICIVGNGAVAKAAALGFAQSGQSVTLLSPPVPVQPPTKQASWDVRVYALNHTAHKLLSSLKVWGALDAARVAPVDAMQVFGDGAEAGGLNFDAYGAHTGTLAWIVEDSNLNQALDAALRFANNVTMVTGRATALQCGADAAIVQLADGSSLEAELVVGADGAESWVRGQCDIGMDYRSYGQRAIATNFHCSVPHHGVAHQWFTGDEGIVALLPLPGDMVSLVWSAPEMLAESLMNRPAGALAERLSQYAHDRLGKLTPLEPELVRAFPLRLMRPHSMVANRVALVGDAAHVVHPLAGHGMNLGFGDVADLVRIVSEREAHRGVGDQRILARYARARHEEVLLMQLATDGLERLFGIGFEPLRVARNLGLNLLDKLPVLKRRLISHALGKNT